MGGMGSGARWSKKATVESHYALDTADLRRWKLLIPGTANKVGAYEWRQRGEAKPSSAVAYALTVGPDRGTLRLLYRMKSTNADLDYSVPLVTTRCHLGGVRWWFVCPLSKGGTACKRRVRRLYLCGTYFGCRNCHGLTYRSRQESDARVYTLLRAGVSLFPQPSGMSVAQLGLALKALTIQQKRLKRWLK